MSRLVIINECKGFLPSIKRMKGRELESACAACNRRIKSEVLLNEIHREVRGEGRGLALKATVDYTRLSHKKSPNRLKRWYTSLRSRTRLMRVKGSGVVPGVMYGVPVFLRSKELAPSNSVASHSTELASGSTSQKWFLGGKCRIRAR